MLRWILTIIIAVISLYVAFWGAFLHWALLSTGGQVIVASEGATLSVVPGGIQVTHETAQAVGVTKSVLSLLGAWYVPLVVMALTDVWLLTSRRKTPG